MTQGHLIGNNDASLKVIKTWISSYYRLNNSASGNPRFQVETDHGLFRTLPDAAFAGQITNSECCTSDPDMFEGPVPVEIYIDKENQIRGIRFTRSQEI